MALPESYDFSIGPDIFRRGEVIIVVEFAEEKKCFVSVKKWFLSEIERETRCCG